MKGWMGEWKREGWWLLSNSGNGESSIGEVSMNEVIYCVIEFRGLCKVFISPPPNKIRLHQHKNCFLGKEEALNG